MKNNKFWIISNILLIFLGSVLAIYDPVLLILNPGTFLDNLLSFTHVWLLFGGYLIFLGIYRLKTKHSFWKIWKSWIKVTISILLSLIFVISMLNLSFILRPELSDLSEPCDYVIVLGGGIDKNGKLPDSVQERVNLAAEYLLQHKDAVCVVSGGTLKWQFYAEAPEAKRQLVIAGVPEQNILIEDKALDTIQNFQYSVEKLSSATGKTKKEILESRVLIVTSKFHMRRAQRLAARMGFCNVRGLGTKISAIKVPHSYLKEICSYIKLNLRIVLTGKPKPIA